MNIEKINEKYCLHDCVINKIEIKDSVYLFKKILEKKFLLINFVNWLKMIILKFI